MSQQSTAPIAAPLVFTAFGQTAEAAPEQHLRDLIENVLFTSPGERVMRPTFGSGLLQLVFAPNSEQLATAVQTLVAGSLQESLGDLIDVAELLISQEDSTFTISIDYVVRSTGELANAVFERTL